jgi:hypothetical protein
VIRALFAALALALAAHAQVQVSVSIVPHDAAKRLLNRRAANVVSPWIGTARNAGAERVLVAESAVLAQMARYQPLDRAAMSLVIADAAQYSLLARLARGGQDITALGAAVASGRSLASPWPLALASVAWGGPYLVGRIRGIERPVGASFESLAAGWPLVIDPGSTAGFHVFSARRSDAEPSAAFVLSVGAASVKVAQ